MRHLVLVLALALGLPMAAWGADGDSCPAAQWDGAFGGSVVKSTSCVLLCDDKTDDSACGDGFYEMDRHMADFLVFHIVENTTGCTGNIVLETVPYEGGTASTINATFDASVDGNQHLMNLSNPVDETDIMYQNLIVSGSGMSCTGSVDVMMIGYEVGR